MTLVPSVSTFSSSSVTLSTAVKAHGWDGSRGDDVANLISTIAMLTVYGTGAAKCLNISIGLNLCLTLCRIAKQFMQTEL